MSKPIALRPREDGTPKPALTDIPNFLRYMADEIEAGRWHESEEDAISTLVCVEYLKSGEVKVGAFGEVPRNKAQVVGILHLGAQIFTPEPGDISRGDIDFDDAATVVPIR